MNSIERGVSKVSFGDAVEFFRRIRNDKDYSLQESNSEEYRRNLIGLGFSNEDADLFISFQIIIKNNGKQLDGLPTFVNKKEIINMMQRRIEEGNERISKILGEGKVVTDSVAAPIACSFIRRVLKALDIA